MRRLRREDEVARIRDRLLRFGFPRLRMLLLVLLTGGSGLLASYIMLRAGLASMPLRYPAALLLAYAVFLLLLRAFAERGADNFDVPGGSGGNTGDSARATSGDHAAAAHAHNSGWLDGAAGADEAALPLLLVVTVVAIACASLWVVVSAPTLFAELAIDGALSATLYRRLRGLETRHWLDTAVRHTIVPFAVTAVAVVTFALVAQHVRPDAHSIGQVFAHRGAAAADEP